MSRAWQNLINKINSARSCLLITDHLPDQTIFVEAMSTVAPGTLLLLADCCDDAFVLMKRSKVVPNCIFIELRRHCADEINFLLAIKRIPFLREVPVIVHSDEAQPYIISPLKEIGVSGIYSRPYDVEGVCNVLHVYFNKYVYASLN